MKQNIEKHLHSLVKGKELILQYFNGKKITEQEIETINQTLAINDMRYEAGMRVFER